MRTPPCAIHCLILVACTPETELKQDSAGAPPNENTSSLSSPQPDPLSGRLIEPPSGATGIPTNLAFLVIGFTESVMPTGVSSPFVLRSAVDTELPIPLGPPVSCVQTCYQIVVPGTLAPTSLHTLEAVPGALQFLDGKPIPAGSAGSFTTAQSPDPFVPRVVAFTAEVTAGCIAVHLAADEPVRAEIVASSADQTVVLPVNDFASTIDFSGRLPAPAAGSTQVMARVSDRAGNLTASPAILLDLPPALPRIFITEVLANPAGSESTQEFVEIYNGGSEAVSLAGFAIADKAGSDGLPEVTLPPGTFALIVAEKYDPAEGNDVSPREGALLARVAGRIGGDGLSNAGEAVQLLTAGGQLVSQYGGFVDVSATAWAGKSVKRSTLEACDGPSAWSASPTPATPGW